MHSCPHMNLNILLSELSSDKEISRNAQTWARPHPTGCQEHSCWKEERERRGCPVWCHHQSFGEWRFLLLLTVITITQSMESAEVLWGCVCEQCQPHLAGPWPWAGHPWVQKYLPYLFSVASQASLYEQFSYKWTVNHVGLKMNECFSKLRSPNAHFKHKRQVAALKTKYSDLT